MRCCVSILVLLAVGVLVLVGGLGMWAFNVAASSPHLLNEELSFDHQVAIPPLLEPIEQNGRKVYDLTVQEGQAEILPGLETPTWGVNGPFLAPTIRASEGDHVAINVTNELDETTTMHWHGMHLPVAMDGGPHQEIDPGETWEPYWTIRQEATTLWYHPHQMGKTAEHVYNGIAGLFIIDDANSRRLELPKAYGVDDIPLIIQDKTFSDSGSLRYRPDGDNGMLGDKILINGTYNPHVDVPAKNVRLRLLNGSNARRYNIGFSDNREFHQIASDGGFLEAPVPLDRLVLSPGERAEIIVDLTDGNKVVLMSYALGPEDSLVENLGEAIMGMGKDEDTIFNLIELRPQPTDGISPPLPERLNTIARWEESQASNTRQFSFNNGSRINGLKMDMARIDEVVEVGTIEIWELSNPSFRSHPIHIHDVQFLVLDRNGDLPPPNEQGWKDTITVNKDETVRVIMQFRDYVDSELPYMFHCHILEHEDRGMMGQFLVVDEGGSHKSH
jgi:FtsP/CotA-like multicopper oxidase with cupredoxin domain